MMKKWTRQLALEFCYFAERKLRPIGYHCALTGSCLYGNRVALDELDDVDIIIYPNNDDGLHEEPAEQVLGELGIPESDIRLLGNEESDYARKVWRAMTPQGRQIDFFFLTDESP